MSRHVTITMDGTSRLLKPAGTTFHRPAGSMTIARSNAINQAQATAVARALDGLAGRGGGRAVPGGGAPSINGAGVANTSVPAGLVVRRAVISETSDDVTYRVTLEVTIDLAAAERHLQGLDARVV